MKNWVFLLTSDLKQYLTSFVKPYIGLQINAKSCHVSRLHAINFFPPHSADALNPYKRVPSSYRIDAGILLPKVMS